MAAENVQMVALARPVTMLIVGALAACGSSSGARPSVPRATHHSIELTSFGATTVTWNATHSVDPHAPKDVVSNGYLPRLSDGRDRFENVGFDSTVDRVFSMTLQFPIGSVDRAEAKRQVLAELPADAVQIFDVPEPTEGDCQLVQYQSAALGAVMAHADFPDPDGVVDVGVFRDTPTGKVNDPANVTTAIVVAHGTLHLQAIECP